MSTLATGHPLSVTTQRTSLPMSLALLRLFFGPAKQEKGCQGGPPRACTDVAVLGNVGLVRLEVALLIQNLEHGNLDVQATLQGGENGNKAEKQ